MPARIPQNTRSGVIDSWLSGDSTHVTATKNGVSVGSVTNIVEEHRSMEGPERADLLRSLAVAISKTGITAFQCAQGHRLVMFVKRMGIRSEDELEGFLSDISNRYVEAGQDPSLLFKHINQLHFFLEKNQGPHGRISIPQIDAIIEGKKEEERRLNGRISTLESQKTDIEKDISDLELEKAKVESELQWDAELKEKLSRNGFKNEDVGRFVDAALLMKERGYDIFDIMKQFSKFEKIGDACASVKLEEVSAGIRRDQILAENQALEVRISQNSLKLRELVSLQPLGFGFREFRMLRDIITEVGEENGVIGNDAVKNFFEDLQNHYYEYVRLGKSVSELRTQQDQLRARDNANYISNVFQDFLKSYLKSSESNTEYKPNTDDEDNRSGKKVKPDDNNVASAQGESGEPLRDSTIETPDTYEKPLEGDNLCEILLAEHERGEDQALLRTETHTQENLSSNSDVQPESASQRGTKEMKIKNDRVVPPGKKNLSFHRPIQMPKSYVLKRSSRSDSISGAYIPKTKSHPALETGESWPSMDQIQDGRTDTILKSMSADRLLKVYRNAGVHNIPVF